MKASFAIFCAFVAAAALPYALQAQGGDDILDKVINRPPVSAWRIDGLGGKPAVRNDAAVQGGKAVRVEVPGKGEHPWSVFASNPIDKPVKAGDNLVLAFWARLEKGENGATSTTLPSNAVQMSSEPYTALFSQPVTLGPEWKMYEVKGKADRAYAGGTLNVSLHLATAKQVIDLGPVFVLDMGQTAG
ncbi:MAG: hypothetical protein JWO81_467 [Alphaproteobacteria bacterium]|nr:hypothetical protein [Alphaproteobacteria bacterium]